MACDVCLGKNEQDCPICGGPRVMITCPTCRGFGVIDCTAYDIDNVTVVDVTQTAYFLLPDTEEEAQMKGQHYCKCDACRCPHCWGEGRIPEDY